MQTASGRWMWWSLCALLVGCPQGDDGDDDDGDDGAATDSGATDPTEGGSDPTANPTMTPTADPTMDPTADPTMDPTADPTMDPTAADGCDPAGCAEYCEWARCLWEGDLDGSMCRAACEEFCGDAFFEDSDRDLLLCQAKVSNDFNCADTQACCDEVFTNQICPD
jgi:hypothetical protein